MGTQLTKIVLAMVFGFAICFAQETPDRKLAVYVSGSSDAGINKSLGNKLLLTMVRSGIYLEIGDPDYFQDEITKSGKSDLASIIQVTKRHGADYVCVVNMIEAFGAYSLSARLIKISGSQVVKTGLTDRSLKSLDDLTAASNELARQLLPPSAAAIIPSAAPAQTAQQQSIQRQQQQQQQPQQPSQQQPAVNANAPYAFLASGSFGNEASPQYNAPQRNVPTTAAYPSPYPAAASNNMPVDRVAAAQAAARKQCARTYNINEVLMNLRESFPNTLKDCSTDLAKNMAMSFIPGRKKIEPKSFMQQCAVDGIRNEIPDGFPNADKIVGSVNNFVQGILNTAMSGGAVDPKKLISSVASMNVMELLNDVKRQASGPCVVNEPY